MGYIGNIIYMKEGLIKEYTREEQDNNETKTKIASNESFQGRREERAE